MISAATCCSAYVVGSSIAIVATGPMPGSTPMRVPRRQPIRVYIRLIAVSATPKPVAICWRRSISALSGPDRQLQAEPDHEDADREHGERDTGAPRFPEPGFMARRAR